jgi:hypothetical protein
MSSNASFAECNIEVQNLMSPSGNSKTKRHFTTDYFGFIHTLRQQQQQHKPLAPSFHLNVLVKSDDGVQQKAAR